jgi:cullin 3
VLLDKILRESFGGNEKIKQTMRESYDAFLSSDLEPDTSARFLALFIHKQMKKENPLSKHKALKDEIRGTNFEQVVYIFRFLWSKDTFETFFTQHLSERLLKKCSSSHDRELEFINCIKAECGQQFFQKVE